MPSEGRAGKVLTGGGGAPGAWLNSTSTRKPVLASDDSIMGLKRGRAPEPTWL